MRTLGADPYTTVENVALHILERDGPLTILHLLHRLRDEHRIYSNQRDIQAVADLARKLARDRRFTRTGHASAPRWTRTTALRRPT